MLPERTALATALILLLAASPALPQEPRAPQPPPQVTLADLDWLVGTWRGDKDGDRIEEAWFEPAAGAMLGAFRWLRGERVVVYELLALEGSAEGVVLLLRHFGPGLAAREERDGALAFDLVEARPGEVLFAGRDPERPTRLGYRKGADGELVAVLERTRGGETTVEEFVYRRR
jgi:hypothetical protein